MVLEGRLDEGLVSCYGSCLNKPVSYVFYSSFCLSAFVCVYILLCLALLRFQVHRLFFYILPLTLGYFFIFLSLPPLSPISSLSFSLCLAIYLPLNSQLHAVPIKFHAALSLITSPSLSSQHSFFSNNFLSPLVALWPRIIRLANSV